MPTKDDPRVVLRIGEEDHRVLKAAAALEGSKLGTWIRKAAVTVARAKVGVAPGEADKPGAVPAEPGATIPAPPADLRTPVSEGPPPAASRAFGCPFTGCEVRGTTPAGTCPVHGRRFVRKG